MILNGIGRRRAGASVVLGSKKALALALLCLSASACGEAGEAVEVAPPTYTGTTPPQGPPRSVVGGFSVEFPPVTLKPGEERSVCYLAPINIEGPSKIIGGGVLTVGAGMHHGNITTRPRSGDSIRECADPSEGFAAANALKGGAVLFGSSTQIVGQEWQTFPEGMGFRIPDGQEIAADIHLINPTGEAITVAPKYEWFAIDEASVTQRLGPFAWRAAEFEIPPGSEYTFKSGCYFPEPMKIVHVLPHMHKLGTSFTASYIGGPKDGQLFLKSEGYDPDNGVMVGYDPPVDLGQGSGASFSCTWRNTLSRTVVEGIGDDEMCILFGYAYPPESAFTALATSADSCIFIAPP